MAFESSGSNADYIFLSGWSRITKLGSAD